MFSEEDYYGLIAYNEYVANQQQKKKFWETGFGKGLSSLWSWATTNPDQAAAIITKNQNLDPLKASSGVGYVGGNYPGQPNGNSGGNGNPNNNNNGLLLIILGIVVVVVLFFIFKNK